MSGNELPKIIDQPQADIVSSAYPESIELPAKLDYRHKKQKLAETSPNLDKKI